MDIGLVETCESWRLESRFFPSKVGGKPAWLSLKNIPSYKNVKCNYCDKPCIFLCQVYAPYDNCEDAFHRTIYLFICVDVSCNKTNQNGNIKVLRSQLARENKFYPADPPVEEENWQTNLNVTKWSKVCHVCGIAAPSHCAKCKAVNYCCREHQLLDWKESHRFVCGIQEKSTNVKLLFPEYELVIERIEGDRNDNNDNDEDDEKINLANEEAEIKKYETLVNAGKGGTLQNESNVDDDMEKMAAELNDKTFDKFKYEVDKFPDQVLRYERGGDPLYISSSNKPMNIPPCTLCGGERQFEFQIMPQLIHFLKFEDVLNSIDWGILLVFTCKNSCKLLSVYAEEYVWKQDIIENK